MATITRTSANTWQGTFNLKQFRITAGRANTEAVTIAPDGSKQPVTGPELRSLMRFYNWHIATGRESSDLPVYYAACTPNEQAA